MLFWYSGTPLHSHFVKMVMLLLCVIFELIFGKKIPYSQHVGLCFPCMDGLAIYVFQTIQIEATLNNQSSCRF